jgi:hypothetical protein
MSFLKARKIVVLCLGFAITLHPIFAMGCINKEAARSIASASTDIATDVNKGSYESIPVSSREGVNGKSLQVASNGRLKVQALMTFRGPKRIRTASINAVSYKKIRNVKASVGASCEAKCWAGFSLCLALTVLSGCMGCTASCYNDRTGCLGSCDKEDPQAPPEN